MSFSPNTFEYLMLHSLSRVFGCVPVLGLNTGMGGSFKSYLVEENMPQRLAALKKGLDEESLRIVDRCVYRILNDPEFYGSRKCNEMTLIHPKDYLDEDEKTVVKEFLKKLPFLRRQFPMTSFEHSPEATYYHNGLIRLSAKGKEYLKGKDFIDGGAYIGDSAITFAGYGPRKIYSFDISTTHQAMYAENMRRNGISPDQYELVLSALYNRTQEGKTAENFGGNTSILNNGGNFFDSIRKVTLDHFREERKLNVGFFKLDIEGAEPEAVEGARKTIQECRPILSLSIYHNPQSFFELKPFLESLDIDYAYRVFSLSPACIPHLPLSHRAYWRVGACSFGETCLFAYPRELE